MNWRFILYFGIPLAAFSGGYYIAWRTPRIETRTEVVEIEKRIEVETERKTIVETKTEWRDRVVTKERIVRPDGTVEERTINENRELKEAVEERSTEISLLRSQLEQRKTTVVKVQPDISHYSLGLQIPVKFSREVTKVFSVRDVNVSLGFRPLDPIPVWIEGGFQPSTNTISIGVRYEF